MTTRKSDLLWLRDMLEHMLANVQQLEWTQDRAAEQYLTEAMLRDLDCCRRLCLTLRRRSCVQSLN